MRIQTKLLVLIFAIFTTNNLFADSVRFGVSYAKADALWIGENETDFVSNNVEGKRVIRRCCRKRNS